MNLAIVLFMVSLSIGMGYAYAHGGGTDQAPPISFAGMNVTVETKLMPSDLSQLKESDSAEMQIRLFDANTNNTLPAVTYRIAMHNIDGLLAQKLFYDEDGILNVEIRPKAGCAEDRLWRCTTYYGTEHPTAVGALYAIGSQIPVISGPIFEKGGLYNLRIDIEGATGPKTLIDEILFFETFVSIAHTQNFTETLNGIPYEIGVKTYYDIITEFDVDDSGRHMILTMPFDWNPSYIEQVSVVHEEIRMPKKFAGEFGTDRQLYLYVNDVRLGERSLILDPYSYSDVDILHLLITNSDLNEINEKLGVENHDSSTMQIKILPHDTGAYTVHSIKSAETGIGSDGIPSRIVVKHMEDTWGGISFELAFLDENDMATRNVLYDFSLLDKNGMVVEMHERMMAVEGIDVILAENAMPDAKYELNVAIFDADLNGIASISIKYADAAKYDWVRPVVDELVQLNRDGVGIPSWVKEIAGEWARGNIDADDINETISIIAPEYAVDGLDDIPYWVKTVVMWWSEDKISDAEFVNWLEYIFEVYMKKFK